jgi:hypothetical protein
VLLLLLLVLLLLLLLQACGGAGLRAACVARLARAGASEWRAGSPLTLTPVALQPLNLLAAEADDEE